MQVWAWFAAYFARAPLPDRPLLAPAGTPFQQRVWRALAEIPLGQTRTYGELATRLGTSPRAVGGALRANPIPIIIPCHRILAAQGLGGYAGASEEGRRRKAWLLAHEGYLCIKNHY
ncbi:MAG: methylated-DNA--[protein]-cysteine S-methyltransferase [Halothiobacillaceae bacterium]